MLRFRESAVLLFKLPLLCYGVGLLCDGKAGFGVCAHDTKSELGGVFRLYVYEMALMTLFESCFQVQ